MKAGIVAASAALVGSAIAASHNAHAGFHFRRNGYAADDGVCTVYTTVYVTALPSVAPNTTVYVAASPVPETTTSCTEESTSAVPPPAYTPAPLPSSEKPVVPSSSSEKPHAPSSPAGYVPAPPKPTHEAPAPSKPAAPKPKPSKPAYTGGNGSWNKPNGKKWSITYTPYTKGGDCKPQSEVKYDIGKIAGLGYTAIRVYSTDCGVFENVVPACKEHGLNIIYGIFLDATNGPNSQGANEQLQDIIDHAPKESMSMIIVGNEYISGHGGSAAALAPYVNTVREKVRAAGFPSSIPITTTETVAAWEENGHILCSVIDIFAAQVQPYFDGGKTASEAGQFAAAQLEQAAKVCPEAAAKGKFISEIGWPASGSPNGKAIAGKSQQREAMKSIIENVGDHACIFSYQSDSWKAPGPWKVEQYFGCADVL